PPPCEGRHARSCAPPSIGRPPYRRARRVSRFPHWTSSSTPLFCKSACRRSANVWSLLWKQPPLGFNPTLPRPLIDRAQPSAAVLRAGTLSLNNYFLPGTRYAFCALEALSAIALNSAPVQALAVVTSEIVPAADAASNEAMMFSASLHSEMSRKSESPVVK